MPGSEYYDREPSSAEIEVEIRWKREKVENWKRMLDKLYTLTPNSKITDRRFDAKLEELQDFVKARIWEIKI